MPFSTLAQSSDETTTTLDETVTVGETFEIPEDSITTVDVQASCIDNDDASNAKIFNVRRHFKNTGGTITPSEQIDTTGPADVGTGLGASVAIANTDDVGRVDVTGDDGEDLNWRVDRQVVTVAAAAAGPAFDIADLPWSGLWAGNFTGSPWAAVASAGASGSNGNLTEGTNPPATSAALNTHTGADFDGTNDVLGNANAAASFLDSKGYGIAIVFDSDDAVADGAVYANPSLLGDGSGCSLFFAFSDHGVKAGHLDGGGYQAAVKGCTNGSPHLAIAWFDKDDGFIRIEVDGSAGTPAAAGEALFSGGALALGVNWDSSARFNGKIYLVGLIDRALSATERANIKAYVNTRFGLAL